MVQPPNRPTNRPKPKIVDPPPAARRLSPRREREMRRQRLIVFVSAAAIGIALLAVLAGVLYDQVYVPSRPVARVGDQSLSRNAYWDEKRHQMAATISQSLFLTTFGAQFAQQVLSQIGTVNTAVTTIKSDPVDSSVVEAWVDRQIVKQGAGKMSIQVSEADIAQLINANYGPGFGPTTETTSTMTLTPATLEPEATVATPEATSAAGTPQATALTTTDGVTPTATLAPTEVPTVTPQNEEAIQRVDAIYNKLYDTYVQQLAQVDPTLRPRLTVDDFRAGLHEQFERQALALKVQEQLVPDAGFTPTTEPSNIEARHILINVTVPISATEQERDAAFEARRPAAEALLARVRGGESFESVAKEASDDFSTRAEGGMLPGFKPNGETINGSQLDPAIVDAVAKLSENQTSDLVRTPFGWHIVQLVKRTVDTREDQLRNARSQAFDKWLEEQRAASTVEYFPATTPMPTALPTGTALPLPTADLAGSPSPTPEVTTTPAPETTTTTPTPTP